MSYAKFMFHKIAEEAQRIAEDEDCKQLDDDDVFAMADALAHILVNREYNNLACCAAELVACMMGGMYEVFQEMPEIKSRLIDELMECEGYDNICSDWLDMYVKKMED